MLQAGLSETEASSHMRLIYRIPVNRSSILLGEKKHPTQITSEAIQRQWLTRLEFSRSSESVDMRLKSLRQSEWLVSCKEEIELNSLKKKWQVAFQKN